MKPHPRIRKTIKWGGGVVTVLSLIVAIQTLHELRTWQSASGWYIGLGGGCIGIGNGRAQQPVRPLEYILFLPEASFQRGNWWVVVPLWMIAAGTLAAAAVAKYMPACSRRAGTKRCPKCNYDRAGLAVGAKCPECRSAAP